MHAVIQRAGPALLIAALAIVTTPKTAHAISGLYMQLGIGYGTLTGRELIASERGDLANDYPQLDADECCPNPGLGASFRLGFSIFGFGGPEFGIIGTGWNLGQGNQGGSGVVGGGIRLYPLKFIGLMTGLDTRKFPLDIGIGVLFGYSVTGQDFLYEGTAVDLDFHIDWKITSFMALGLKLDVMLPSYGSFVFTSFKNKNGRCYSNHRSPPDDPQDLAALTGSKDSITSTCNDESPGGIMLTPQLLLTFYFDILDV